MIILTRKQNHERQRNEMNQKYLYHKLYKEEYQSSLLGISDLHGVGGRDLEPSERALGLSGLNVCLKLHEGYVTTAGNQTYFLEPRKPNNGIRGRERKLIVDRQTDIHVVVVFGCCGDNIMTVNSCCHNNH